MVRPGSTASQTLMLLLSEAAAAHAATLCRSRTPPRVHEGLRQPSSGGATPRAETPRTAAAAASSREDYAAGGADAAAGTLSAAPPLQLRDPTGPHVSGEPLANYSGMAAAATAAPAEARGRYVPVSDTLPQRSVRVDADGSRTLQQRFVTYRAEQPGSEAERVRVEQLLLSNAQLTTRKGALVQRVDELHQLRRCLELCMRPKVNNTRDLSATNW